MNITRQFVIMPVPCRWRKSRPKTAAASRLPTTYPSCSRPEKNPRPRAGSVSRASAAPTPHSPPMATPNSARQMRKLCSVGAKADANSKTEKDTTLSISVGRRPYRSAIAPNRRAPAGRITSVQKIASATCFTPAWKSTAIAFRQKVSRKKSKASSVQPRKQAENVLRCTRVSARISLKYGIAES